MQSSLKIFGHNGELQKSEIERLKNVLLSVSFTKFGNIVKPDDFIECQKVFISYANTLELSETNLEPQIISHLLFINETFNPSLLKLLF